MGFGERYTYRNFKQGREIEEIQIGLPKPPNRKDVDGYNFPKSEQRFRPPDPDMITAINHVIRNNDQPTQEQKDFIRREWKRRLNGYWFYNNGHLEYVTGQHYFYIGYWRIPVRINVVSKKTGKVLRRVKKVGLPDFRDSDRDFFYAWRSVELDSNSFGLIYLTNRRDGKTHKGNSINFEYASRLEDVVTGIQSKTGDDAKLKVYYELLRSWTRLPEYFKPVDIGESWPSQGLTFDEPAIRSTKQFTRTMSKVLHSKITWRVAKDSGYDGWDLVFYYGDEIGKTPIKEADVYERWYVVKYALADDQFITGKGLLTTTVEDIGEAEKSTTMLYEESDSNRKDGVGRTTTGMNRLFKPACYGYAGVDTDGKPMMDSYGYSYVDRAHRYLMKAREGKSPRALRTFIRKYPLTIKEALRPGGHTCHFNSVRLGEQKEHLQNKIPEYERGKLIFEGGSYKRVKFIPDENGPFKILQLPEKNRRNNVRTDTDGNPFPGNMDMYRSGTDPFDHWTTTSDKPSNPATYVFRMYDPAIDDGKDVTEWETHQPILEYNTRPETSNTYYFDMLKMCIFYGVGILIESQKPGLINFFYEMGFWKFIMGRPPELKTKSPSTRKGNNLGAPASKMAIQAYTDAINTYVSDNLINYVPLIKFVDLLDSLLSFEMTDTNRYDEAVGFGWTMLAVNTPYHEHIQREAKAPLMRKYNNRGNVSRKIMG